MNKQVGKTAIFTKDSLKIIQDKMRALCIESFNTEYDLDNVLKKKLKGRNQDINVDNMDNYQEMKDQLEKNKIKLEQADNKSKKLDTSSNEVNSMISNLRQSKLNKSTYLLSEEEKDKLENYIDELEEENFGLRKSLTYLKNKFIKLTKFLQEKLFGWGKKDPIYKKVVDDLVDENILDKADIKDIKKEDLELRYLS